MSKPEIRSLFEHLEELRRRARLSQVDVAELANTTRRSYISWCKGEGPAARKKPDLQYAIFILEQGRRRNELPIRGHDRRPGTAERRREVIKELRACYPINPYQEAQGRA